jgi:hypothetical protein
LQVISRLRCPTMDLARAKEAIVDAEAEELTQTIDLPENA